MPRRTNTTRRAQRRKHHHAARDFRCVGCRRDVSATAPGTAHRNHCPSCLTSRHLDGRVPGDRNSTCLGRMDAVAVTARDDGEWLVVHECRSCGELSANRVAGDDNAAVLVALALRPLAVAATAAAAAAGAGTYTPREPPGNSACASGGFAVTTPSAPDPVG